jgi:ring-1,2-phenylacetyl-CoA epoxidase subunit PaaC
MDSKMMMDPIELQAELSQYILALADDELVLGHRDSQWCGHAPILEEDIAFANIALDEIGHAGLWYGLYAELTGQDPEKAPDRLVYWRPAAEFRCTPLVELPNGDWAFSILRQYLFDAAEIARLTGLADSQQPELAAIAQKAVKEEHYHLRHTRAWVERLGQGSQESQRRMQSAWLALWPYRESLFDLSPAEAVLADAGLVPDANHVRSSWQNQVLPLLAACGLDQPELEPEAWAGRGQHYQGFPALIAELQSVARQDPQAEW